MWIEQCKTGDQAAFKQLYSTYSKRVFNLCYRLCNDRGEAEEVTQEIFVQVWENIGKYSGESRFYTWLHALSTNVAITHIRKRKRWWRLLVENQSVRNHEANAATADSFVDESHHYETHYDNSLDKLIAKLPEQARLVFILFAVEGYKHEEISNTLNIAVGSSKAQYHRARTLLAKWLNEASNL